MPRTPSKLSPSSFLSSTTNAVCGTDCFFAQIYLRNPHLSKPNCSAQIAVSTVARVCNAVESAFDFETASDLDRRWVDHERRCWFMEFGSNRHDRYIGVERSREGRLIDGAKNHFLGYIVTVKRSCEDIETKNCIHLIA